MNNSNPSSDVKTKNITFGSVFEWIFGVVVGLAGIAGLFSNPVLAIFFIVSALIVFPPTYNFLKKKLHVSLSTGLKATIVVILLVIGGVLTSQNNSTKISATVAQATASTQSNPSVPTSPAPLQAPIIVSASQLTSDYQANEIAADGKYKGNLVQVSGTIYSIGKDILNNPYVVLQSGEYDPFGVQCMFSQSNESELATLSQGQTVTLQGTVSGKVVDVEVDDCQIMK